MQGGSGSPAPLVEFTGPPGATHASLADDASCCAAALHDGVLCLFDTAAACLRWKVDGRVGPDCRLFSIEWYRCCGLTIQVLNPPGH